MFLYDNNVISEATLRVEAEPSENFVEESIAINKQLLTEATQASLYMTKVIEEYGDSDKVVTEAFSDWMDRIVKILKEFKAKVITLFRRWIDWVAKKLHMKGLYSDEAVKELLANKVKCAKLHNFKLNLPVPVDFGYSYFNELKTPAIVKTAKPMADSIFDAYFQHPNKKSNPDVKKIRDIIQEFTNNVIHGSKKTEITIDDIQVLYTNKMESAKNIHTYETEVNRMIDSVTKIAENLTKAHKTAVGSQDGANVIIALATCLNEHLTSMVKAHQEFIGVIDKTFAAFLPQAEQYLLAND